MAKPMQITTLQAERYLRALEPALDQIGFLGYAAAINTKRLESCLKEYKHRKAEIIRRYGHEVEPGYWEIPTDSPDIAKAESEVKPLLEQQHEVTFIQVSPQQAMEALPGRTLLEIDFMIGD